MLRFTYDVNPSTAPSSGRNGDGSVLGPAGVPLSPNHSHGHGHRRHGSGNNSNGSVVYHSSSSHHSRASSAAHSDGETEPSTFSDSQLSRGNSGEVSHQQQHHHHHHHHHHSGSNGGVAPVAPVPRWSSRDSAPRSSFPDPSAAAAAAAAAVAGGSPPCGRRVAGPSRGWLAAAARGTSTASPTCPSPPP